jgi:hypothetical protein
LLRQQLLLLLLLMTCGVGGRCGCKCSCAGYAPWQFLYNRQRRRLHGQKSNYSYVACFLRIFIFCSFSTLLGICDFSFGPVQLVRKRSATCIVK